MKKIFAMLFIAVMLFAVIASAAPSYITRLSNGPECLAQIGPYSFILNVNVSSANWTRPDSIIILGICIEDSGSVYISTKDVDSVELYSSDFYCYPINITKVYRLGTTEGLRSAWITLFGYKK